MANDENILTKPQLLVKELLANDGEKIPISRGDIVVFVGSNNVGKTQILKDIHRTILRIGSASVVLSEIKINKVGDISYIKHNYSKVRGKDKYINYNGVYIEETDFELEWNQGNFRRLGPAFVKYLDTENRLLIAKTAKQIPNNKIPENPVQYMYRDENVTEKISSLFEKVFDDKNLIVNYRGGLDIPVHIGSKISRTNGEDRVSNSYIDKLTKYPLIEEQGDGMRSLAGILMGLFVLDRSIYLLDEPEAFLHPGQARELGKLIASEVKGDSQIFISTHSEEFIKGLLDSKSDKVKMISVERESTEQGDINHLRILDNAKIETLWSNPILKYSKVISGLFHSKVVICESDTDCLFYETIMDSISGDEYGSDILFTHCGGKERIGEVAKSLLSMNKKVCAVVDVDILNDKNKFRDLFVVMHGKFDEVEADFDLLTSEVAKVGREMNADTIKQKINSILDTVQSEEFPDDAAKKIKDVMKGSTGWKRMKKSVANTLKDKIDAKEAFNRILHKCSEKGLFIVPVGEIEAFFPEIPGHANKWLASFLEKYEVSLNPQELKEAEDFVKKIYEF